jgi:hypothetical protein
VGSSLPFPTREWRDKPDDLTIKEMWLDIKRIAIHSHFESEQETALRCTLAAQIDETKLCRIHPAISGCNVSTDF